MRRRKATVELFEEIRREYEFGVGTIQGVARKFGVHRRLVREALGSALPRERPSPTMRRSDAAYLTSGEVAKQLGVHQTRVQHWFHLGLLNGRQAGRQAQLWIAWDAEIAQRLDGTAPIDGRMVSVRRLCAAQRKHPDEILAWAVAEGHSIYRVRRGTVFRFYILPGEAEHCAG